MTSKPEITLQELTKLCTQKPSSALQFFAKSQLHDWCKIYVIHLPSAYTKKTIAASLREAVIACAKDPQAGSSSSQSPGSSSVSQTPQDSGIDEDYICPKCGILYVDDNMWVGCDNTNCQLFICRHCARLEVSK